MPGSRHEKKVNHINLMKNWHVMVSHSETILLAVDSELGVNTGEYTKRVV